MAMDKHTQRLAVALEELRSRKEQELGSPLPLYRLSRMMGLAAGYLDALAEGRLRASAITAQRIADFAGEPFSKWQALTGASVVLHRSRGRTSEGRRRSPRPL